VVGEQTGVDDRVDRRRAKDPLHRNGVELGAHELSALELVLRVLGVDADDRLYIRELLESLGQLPAPGGREPCDEDAAAARHRLAGLG
jgi:hypothetical protein